MIDATKETIIDLQEYAVIGFASGIDFGKFYEEIENFAKNNLPIKKKVFFLKIVLEKEADILGEYGCKGYNTYGPWKVIGGMNKKHPTEVEIMSAVEFFDKLYGELNF